MIQREWQTVSIVEYKAGRDDYGFTRKEILSERPVQMVVKIYSQVDVNNPKYVDIELVGITKNKSISTENEIRIENDLYVVKYIIPSSRYNQVLMVKK